MSFADVASAGTHTASAVAQATLQIEVIAAGVHNVAEVEVAINAFAADPGGAKANRWASG